MLNVAPVAVNDSGLAYTTNEDTVLTVPVTGVLSNDTDASTLDTLVVTAFSGRSALGANIVLNANGSLSYDPTVSAYLQTLVTGESVQDSFTYTVSDGDGGSATATVTVTITGQGAIEIDMTKQFPSPFAADPGNNATGDTTVVQMNGTDLQIFVNGTLLRTVPASALTGSGGLHDITFTGSGDNDTLVLNKLTSTNIRNVTADAGGGSDTIFLANTVSVQGSLNLTAEAVNIYTNITSTGDQTYNGAVNLGASVTLTGANVSMTGATVALNDKLLTVAVTGSTGSIVGIISGTGGQLAKSGTGTLTLSGANTYTGTTTVNAGTLELSGGSAIADTGAVSIANVAGATLKLNASETIGSLSGGGTTGGTVNLQGFTLNTGDANNTAFAGVISGSGGALIKQGAGTFTLSGANTYTGTTTIDAGTLKLAASGVIPDGAGKGNVIVNGTLDLAGFSETINGLSGGGTVDSSVAGAITFTVGSNDQTTAFAGTIQDTVGTITLEKTGSGILSLAGANTYAGATTINGGTVRLVSQSVSVTNGSFESPALSPGGFVYYGSMSPAQQAALGWTSTGIINSGGGALFSNGSAWGYAAVPGGTQGFSLQRDSALNQVINFPTAGTYELTWRAASRGGGVNPSEVRLDGAPVYSWQTNNTSWTTFTTTVAIPTVGNHTLTFAGLTSGSDVSVGIDLVTLSAIGSLPTTTTVTLTSSGASLDLNDADQTVGSIAGVSGTTITLGSGILTSGGNDASTVFAGGISDTGGASANTGGAIVKTGAGTLSLSGSNAYSGITTISGGALALTGTGEIDESIEIAIASGTTFNVSGRTGGGYSFAKDVTGTGTVIGNLTLSGGGNLQPGDSSGTAIGTLSVVGNTTITGDFDFDINGANTDLLDVNGTVTLGGTVSFNTIATPTQSLLTLIDNDGTDQITTTFSNIVEGGTVVLSGKTYKFFHNGGDGNDVVAADATTPMVVYVDDFWASGINGGQVIADADLGTSASQGAIFKINAFATLAEAIAAVGTGGTIIVNSGTYAETVTLNNGKTLEITGPDAAGAVTINALSTAVGTNVIIEGTSNLTVGDSGNQTIAGVISGTGNLTKQGTGTVTLSNTNTYAGTTNVNAGTLVAASNGALGSAAGGTTVVDGAILGLLGNITISSETISLNGTGAGAGALVNLSGNNAVAATSSIIAELVSLGEIGIGSVAGTLTIDAAINLNSSKLAVSGAGDVVINGIVSGTGVDVVPTENALTASQVFNNVLEANNYILAYELIPSGGVNGANPFPYTVNTAATIQPFDRVAYYLELQTGAGALEYVYVSMDAFTTDVSQIGIPIGSTLFVWQRSVANMNVFSNKAGITTGTSLATGNIEIWPSNYSASNANAIPNASGTAFDFGDGGASAGLGYGSFQIHNYDLDGAGAGTAGQVLLAYNNWRSTGDLGLGSRPTGDPDYTFANNLSSYTVKRMSILVHELVPSSFETDNSLVKEGTGTLTLTAANTYTGTTTVSAGTLLVNGTHTDGGDYEVSGGVLGGTGSTASAVEISGGVLDSGNPGAVESLATGAVTFTGGEFQAQIGAGTGTTAGTSNDVINVTGTVALGAGVSTLDLTTLGTAATGQNYVYTLIANDGTDLTTGTFSGIADGAAVTVGGVNYRLFYNGGTGNDVVLVENSQPTVVFVDDSWAAFTGGTVISDADLGTTGSETAVFGVNAFSSITAALAAVANTTGIVIINAGTYAETVSLADGKTLEITGPNTPGTVNINALTTAVGTNVIIEGTSTLTIGDANSQTIAGTISGSGSLTKTGAGTVTLSNANTYSGATLVNQGVLSISNSTALGTTGAGTTVNQANDARLDLSGGITVAEPLTFSGVSAGLVTTLRNVSGTNTLTGLATVPATIRIQSNGGSLTFAGGVSGTNTFFVLNPNSGSIAFTTNPVNLGSGGNFYADSGGLTVLGVAGNTFGITTFTGGTLRMDVANALPANTILRAGGISYNPNGTLNLNGFSQTVGALDRAGTTATTMQITSATAATLTVNQTTTTNYTGGITGAVSLVKSASGTLTLSGPNTYTGLTTISGGRVTAGSTSSLSPNSAFTVASGAFLELDGFSNSIGSLAGAGTVENANVTAATLTAGGDNTSTTFSGVIQNGTGGGILSLTKTGTGTQTLSGTNTYTGATAVSVGTLLVNGNNSAATGTVTVSSGANLGGTGTVGGIVTALAGSNVQPGVSGVGTLTVNANVNLQGDVDIDISGATADQLDVNGTVTLSGTLTIAGTGPSAALYTIVDNDGTGDVVSGVFSNLNVDGATIAIDGVTYKIFYRGGDGNDVVLANATTPTVVYVDDSWSALTGGMVIADADLGTTANQGAIFKINAFATLAEALAAVGTGGTIIVNGGTYAETVTLDNNKVMEMTGPNVAGTVTINALSSTAGTNIIIEGTSSLTIGDANNQSIAGIVSGSGSLTKTGTGILTLSGTNTFTGALTVENGTLRVPTWNNKSTNGPLGNSASPVTLGSATTQGTLEYTGPASNAPSTLRGLDIAAGGGKVQLSFVGGTFSSNYVHLNGSSLTGAGPLTVDTSNGGTTTSRFILVGASTFSGSITLNANTRLQSNSAVSGDTAAFGVGSSGQGPAITMNTGSVLDIWAGNNAANSPSILIGSLHGTGTVQGEGAGLYTLKIGGDNTNSTFSGVISGANGATSVSVTKVGTGTLTLSGTNTYTGTTAVNLGTLELSGGSAIADTGAVSIANVAGATLKLNASETIGSPSLAEARQAVP